ncbi:MAG: acetyltransferase [Flavobacterium sp.]|jgi:sugar O-acyltransferase (sialic acid O-acetyltransferase NeuD family)|nr:acetyltransferase [Flavobacterium sp.]PZO31398.1 MAG: hexapeptide transferase [Flavobacteriaceae bacterium]
MIIIGAKGHAKEVFDVLTIDAPDSFYFFDNVSADLEDSLFSYPILKTTEQARSQLKKNPDFILGLGNPFSRNKVYNLFLEYNGNPVSAIAKNAVVSKSAVLGKGLNIMPFAFVSADTFIGNGVLINAYASVHHDCKIGEFAEISPGAKVLGNCEIGAFTTIGANATILPKLKIGKNVTIGAGAVITKDIEDNAVVVGVPGKTIKYNVPKI